jgi:hypothetical protein
MKSEQDFQIERMSKLGINTTGQCFEQMVTSVIQLAERRYSEEEVMNMFHNLSMHLPLHYEFLVKEQFKKK